DEEPRRVGRHLQVDHERDHGQDPEQDDRDRNASEDVAEHQRTARGSVASRSPSPNWFSAKTVRKIATEGQIVSHGCVVAGWNGFGLKIEPHVCASRPPQPAVGSLIPAPRNVTPTSIMMFVATRSVPYARSGGTTCGSRCVRMILASRAPTICAASTNSRRRSDWICVRTMRAG